MVPWKKCTYSVDLFHQFQRKWDFLANIKIQSRNFVLLFLAKIKLLFSKLKIGRFRRFIGFLSWIKKFLFNYLGMAIQIRDPESAVFFINYQESESAISVRIFIRIGNSESVIFQRNLLHNWETNFTQFFSVIGMLPLSTRNFISGF